MNRTSISPLRYPGGKASVAVVLERILYENNLQGGVFVEAFAGGAGAAINLLHAGHVDRIILNDLDRAIYCFWRSVTRWNAELIELVRMAELSVDEWHRQREIYKNPGRVREVDLGFAAFYLNRCNRSGIIANGGPIGGLDQLGKWKIDARFNREGLVARIKSLANFGDRIEPRRMDAEDLLRSIVEEMDGEKVFVYADPPYWNKGQGLYLNHYAESDHHRFAQTISEITDLSWTITYDDVPELRAIYSAHQMWPFKLRYSAHHSSRHGGELLIAPHALTIPPSALARLQKLGVSKQA